MRWDWNELGTRMNTVLWYLCCSGMDAVCNGIGSSIGERYGRMHLKTDIISKGFGTPVEIIISDEY